MDDDLQAAPPPAVPLFKVHRPTKLFRSPFDVEDHTRKARWLGISAEDHAKFTHLILRREATPLDFRGLTGDALASRIHEIWDNGKRNA